MVDLAALALRVEAAGAREVERVLAALDARGKQTGKTFEEFGSKTKTVGDSTRKLEGVFRGVGLAMGGVEGPAAKLGNVLLSYAPSGLYVSAAVLGLGILGKAFGDTAKQAEDASLRIQKAIEASLPGKPKDLSALAQRGILTGDEPGSIEDLIARYKKVAAVAGARNAPRTTAGRFLLAEISRLQGRARALDEVGADAREDTFAGALGAAQAFRVKNLPQVQIPGFIIKSLTDNVKEGLKELNLEAIKATAGVDDLSTATKFQVKSALDASEAAMEATQWEEALALAIKDHAKAAKQAAAELIVAGAQLIAGVIRSVKGGDFWGSLAGLGSLAMLIPGFQIPGALIAGTGIVGGALFDHGSVSSGSQPQGSAAGSAPRPAPVYQFNVFGPNDPQAQRAIVQAVRMGEARGL